MKKLLSAALIALAFVTSAPAWADSAISYTDVVNGKVTTIQVTPAKPLPVNATVSATASIAAFNPTGTATLSLTTSSARVALPSADTTALVRNTGSTDAEIKFGGSTVTAATTDVLIPAGQAVAFDVGSATYLAGIVGSGTGSLQITTGTGLPAMTGGGSGGGGGGGAMTLASGAVSSGAYSSGSIASGSIAAGALSAGAGVDGWDLAEGAKADSACATDTGTCSFIALTKRLAQGLTTLNTTAGGAIPAGSNIIGKTGIDQTTPGTTNGVQDASTGSTGSAVPSKAGYVGAQSNGNLTGVIQAGGSAFLNMTTATTTKIITGTASKKVYITNLRLHAGGATTAKFVEGTGTNCGTGTADLSETWDFTASDGMVAGVGLGPVLVMATAGDDVCVTNSAAQNLRVGVAYETH